MILIADNKNKKMSKNSKSSNGVGTLGLLGIAFVVLKLTGVINWSWWLVTLPFWGGFAVALLIIIIYVLFKLFSKE